MDEALVRTGLLLFFVVGVVSLHRLSHGSQMTMGRALTVGTIGVLCLIALFAAFVMKDTADRKAREAAAMSQKEAVPPVSTENR